MSPDEKSLTHLDEAGEAHMVDVSAKDVTKRTAVAEAIVVMPGGLVDRFFRDDLPKGDGPAVARIAGIQAAKKTSELVPLCHPIRIEAADGTLMAAVKALVSVQETVGLSSEASAAEQSTPPVVDTTVPAPLEGVTDAVEQSTTNLLDLLLGGGGR